MRRRRAAATLVAIVLASGLTACGGGDGSGPATDAGGRPLLPATVAGAGGASSLAAEAATDSAARSMLAGGAPVEYRVADGAEAPATEAAAYRFVPAGRGAEAKLAKALGGGDRNTVVEVRHGSWYFHRNDQSGADQTSECRVLPDGSCEERPMPPPPPGVPSAEEGETQLRRILAALDVDVAAGRILAVDSGEPVYQRVVTFEPAVDDVPLHDLTTTVGFGTNGRVEFANGFLGSFEKVGDYPLVGLVEAVERFQSGLVGGDARVATGVAVPEPALDAPAAGQTEPGSRGSADSVPPGPTGEVPPPVDPPAPVEPRIVEITGADLVLTAVHPRCEGEELFLVPAFRLEPDEVGFTAPAVEQTSIAEPADSEASSEPCPGQPEPDEPVGRPEPAPMPPDAGGREPASP